MNFKKMTVAVLLAASVSLCACADKKNTETSKISDTKTETVTAAETTQGEESLPDGEYCELPIEAVEDFNYVTEISAKLFPDASGKKMYGYSGLETIETADGSCSCYTFEFYTYKSKLYSKIATIAKDAESSDIYLYNEDTASYELTELPSGEIDWHEQATAALAVNTQTGNEFTCDSSAE